MFLSMFFLIQISVAAAAALYVAGLHDGLDGPRTAFNTLKLPSFRRPTGGNRFRSHQLTDMASVIPFTATKEVNSTRLHYTCNLRLL